MATSLQDIQNMIASEADQTATITAGTSDWNLRLVYINWAQRDFSETYDWRCLLKEINTLTSQATGNATVALPWDFRKLASFPKITWDGSTTDEFPEIDLTKSAQYADTDKYVTVQGNPRDNYCLVVHPPSLVSGASIYYPYYAVLPSLVSPANISSIPDAEYLVQKSLFYLYRARSDPRFQEAGARADAILARLIENEETRGEAYDNIIQVRPQSSLRWGK